MKANEEFLPWEQLKARLNALQSSMQVNDLPAMYALLKELVPGYQPSGDIADLVSLAQSKTLVSV